MILALCVDDELGLQFNHRRQSRDSAVISDLLNSTDTLWIHPFSAKLFPSAPSVHIEENYLAVAKEGQWCFAEDTAYLDYLDKIEKIILYRWNRIYPRDLVFTFPGKWRLAESTDFSGSSHETVTREVYVP